MSGGAEGRGARTVTNGRRAALCLIVVAAVFVAALFVASRVARGLVGGAAEPPRVEERGRTLVLVALDSVPAEEWVDGRWLAELPTLERLAARSIVYTHCFATSRRGNAAFASLLTGLYPKTHGVGPLSAPGQHRLPEELDTVAEHLAREGWVAACAVSLPQLDAGLSGLAQGFARYDAPPLEARGYRLAAATVDALLGALADLDARGRDVFLVLHLADALEPLGAPEDPLRFVADALAPFEGGAGLAEARAALEHDPGGARAELDRLLGRRRGSAVRAAYEHALRLGELAYVDRELGRLFDELARLGRLERATVVVCGTRGPAGRDVRGGSRVPLLWSGPPAGAPARDERLVQTVDVACGLLAAAGLAPPADLDGSSPAGPRRVQAYVEDSDASDSPAALSDFGTLLALPVHAESGDQEPVDEQRPRPLRWMPEPMQVEDEEGLAKAFSDRFFREYLHPEELSVAALPGGAPVRVVVHAIEGGFSDIVVDPAGSGVAERPLRRTPEGGPRPASLAPTGTEGARAAFRFTHRNAPLRISLSSSDLRALERVHVGPVPLARSPLPRILRGPGAEWPADRAAPAVDVTRTEHGRVRVAVAGPAGSTVEALLGWYPPDAALDASGVTAEGGARSTAVAGREDLLRASGTAPFAVELRRPGNRELMLSVAVDGAQVEIERMRYFGRALPADELHLFLPGWLSGATEPLFAATYPADLPAGAIVLTRSGTGMPQTSMVAPSLEQRALIRRLGPRE